jgi:hypothetical protein
MAKKTEAYLVAERTLPEALHPVFETFVDDYLSACREYNTGGREYRNFPVFADMVRRGWQKPSDTA